jgi:hypothetical protein
LVGLVAPQLAGSVGFDPGWVDPTDGITLARTGTPSPLLRSCPSPPGKLPPLSPRISSSSGAFVDVLRHRC